MAAMEHKGRTVTQQECSRVFELSGKRDELYPAPGKLLDLHHTREETWDPQSPLGSEQRASAANAGEERTSDAVLDQALTSHDTTLEGTINVQCQTESEKGLLDSSPLVFPDFPCQIILYCHKWG